MPIWRDIYASVRADITEGRYKTGDKLPTEKELSERFDVNRHTVRRALAELTGEGVIYVRRGSGAYVAEGVVDYRLGSRVKFSQNIAELGRSPHHALLAAELEAADEATARHLKLKPGAPCVVLDLLSEVDGLPVLVSRHRFPAQRFPGMLEAFRETASISAALRRFGVADYRRAWTRITARTPARSTTAMLKQIEGQPVLHVECLNTDMSGEPIEYSVGDWSAARVQFMVGD
jgi:GntR family phosphonate transport system transcriptional regulator